MSSNNPNPNPIQIGWSVSLKRTYNPSISFFFVFFSSKMPLHFIKLQLGNKPYKRQVSSANFTYVDDFKDAIKSKFSPDLDSYAPHHLTLFQPDGITQIDPETPVSDSKEIHWKPMVVTVDDLPKPASISSTKKTTR